MNKGSSFYNENQEYIEDLLREVEPLSRTVNNSLKGDNEPDFLKDNKDKKIVIKFIKGGEKEGILKDISNFGILINTDESEIFYYKHFIEFYYIKD